MPSKLTSSGSAWHVTYGLPYYTLAPFRAPADDALTMQVFTDRTHIEAFFVRFPPSPHILLH